MFVHLFVLAGLAFLFPRHLLRGRLPASPSWIRLGHHLACRAVQDVERLERLLTHLGDAWRHRRPLILHATQAYSTYLSPRPPRSRLKEAHAAHAGHSHILEPNNQRLGHIKPRCGHDFKSSLPASRGILACSQPWRDGESSRRQCNRVNAQVNPTAACLPGACSV